MKKDAETRQVKERSPRFPFISLEKALERASHFYWAEKRGTAPFAAAAKHWGYSAASSGGLQTFAALKSYGLLEGTHKNVRLSDLALRIILDKRPDSSEREVLKRQAALTPSIAAEINEKWPDGLPSEATLNHFLVLDRGFNEATASKVVKIVNENQIFTSISGNDVQSSNEEITERTDIMKDATNSSVARDAQIRNTGGGATKVKVERTSDRDGLDITLQFNGEPTEGTFEYLKDFIEFKLQQIRKIKVSPQKT